MRRIAHLLLVPALFLAACSAADEAGRREEPVVDETATGDQDGGGDDAAQGGDAGRERVDPRDGGLEVALGEWALTLEAGAVRPGRVTFVIANRGTIGHGFEIEIEGEGDSSGPGSGDDDGLKAETNLLQPGETAELTLNLPAGLYKVECIVQGHDDLGMEGFLEVRQDARLVAAPPRSQQEPSVAVSDFAFAPADLEVAAGEEVTWTNEDPTPHTVTADDGSFDSGTLEPGQTFSTAVEGNGPVTYACQIHPEMTGTISVG